MLGHQLVASWRDRHEVWATLRQGRASYGPLAAPDPARTVFEVDARNLQDLVGALGQSRPEAVINAIGIVKQRPSAKDAIASLEVNALLPHRLADLCRAAGARLIHLSTDCVFSGLKGRYVEGDPSDAQDLYGRTKYLGEVQEPHCLTLRTSIIGLELARNASLIEWFLAQRGTVRGFRRAIYSGLTTPEMARAIEHFLLREPDLSGLWHLSSAPINKYDLLATLMARLGRTDAELVPDDKFVCDRSLDGTALQERAAYRVASWDEMLDELAEQITKRKAS
jgi:dTDP-4-dehydrorhamnose reductase